MTLKLERLKKEYMAADANATATARTARAA